MNETNFCLKRSRLPLVFVKRWLVADLDLT